MSGLDTFLLLYLHLNFPKFYFNFIEFVFLSISDVTLSHDGWCVSVMGIIHVYAYFFVAFFSLSTNISKWGTIKSFKLKPRAFDFIHALPLHIARAEAPGTTRM